MPLSVNKVILIGRVGQPPEVRYMPNGKAVVNFSLATSESWKDSDGERVEKTEWHKLIAFDKKAEVIGEHVVKGHELYIEGKLQTRKWQDKDGQDKYTTEIVVEVFKFGAKPKTDGEDGQEKPARQPSAKPQNGGGFDDLDDDIPFVFNMNTVTDTMGTSKALSRARHGRLMSLLPINRAET